MLPKILIVLFLIAILVSLFTAVVFMVRDPSTTNNRRTVRALSWRVGLQVGLIVFLILAYFMGWIRPHALLPQQPANPAPTSDAAPPQ